MGGPSIWNIVLPFLKHVVGLAAYILRAVVNDSQHVLSGFALRRRWLEPVAQLLDGASAETRQSSVEHQRDESDDSLAIAPEKEPTSRDNRVSRIYASRTPTFKRNNSTTRECNFICCVKVKQK